MLECPYTGELPKFPLLLVFVVREPALNEFSPFKVIKSCFLAHYMVYTGEGSMWLQDTVVLSLEICRYMGGQAGL